MNKLKNSKLILTIVVLVLYFAFVLFFNSIELTITNFLLRLIFLFLIIFIYKDDLKQNFKDYRKDKKRFLKVFLYFIVVFVLSFIIRNIVVNLYSNITGGELLTDSSNSILGTLFASVPLGTLFAGFLTIIFYPIVEELVFRKSMGDSIKNPVLFIILSSLFAWYFQVTLVNPSINEFILAIGVLFNSVFCAIIYTKTKNILYAIFPRMLYNLVICVIQLVFLISG